MLKNKYFIIYTLSVWFVIILLYFINCSSYEIQQEEFLDKYNKILAQIFYTLHFGGDNSPNILLLKSKSFYDGSSDFERIFGFLYIQIYGKYIPLKIQIENSYNWEAIVCFGLAAAILVGILVYLSQDEQASSVIYSYFKIFTTNDNDNFNTAFIKNDSENLCFDPNLKYVEYKDRMLCELGDFQKYYIDRGLLPPDPMSPNTFIPDFLKVVKRGAETQNAGGCQATVSSDSSFFNSLYNSFQIFTEFVGSFF